VNDCVKHARHNTHPAGGNNQAGSTAPKRTAPRPVKPLCKPPEVDYGGMPTDGSTLALVRPKSGVTSGGLAMCVGGEWFWAATGEAVSAQVKRMGA
jgi:hypothetical protein